MALIKGIGGTFTLQSIECTVGPGAELLVSPIMHDSGNFFQFASERLNISNRNNHNSVLTYTTAVSSDTVRGGGSFWVLSAHSSTAETTLVTV